MFSPERALLEMLSEVGVRQPLQEAREIAEGLYSLRADVLRALLLRCTSVKTVRLCLQIGRELSLPWASKLDRAKLPTGGDRPRGFALRRGTADPDAMNQIYLDSANRMASSV